MARTTTPSEIRLLTQSVGILSRRVEKAVHYLAEINAALRMIHRDRADFGEKTRYGGGR